MPKIDIVDIEGARVGEMELSEALFGAEIHEAAMHLVVRSIMANKRQGTQSAKTRSEVRGGGRKIYRQKGTGNARHHSNRAPQFTHGGVVFAPKPRDYVVNVPRKVRRLAFRSALSAKVQAGEMIVLDQLTLSAPKTKVMASILSKLGADRKALVVLADKDEAVSRASSNLPGVMTALVNTLNVYDILSYDKFIITKEAVRQVEEVYAS